MVVYRLLGSGVTDANGVASVNYTGVGAGEMDLVASTSNPITDTSLVSDGISIFDCLWIDDGTPANHKTSWYNYNSILTVDYPTQYNATRVRKLEADTTQRYYYYNDTAISTDKIGGYNSIITPSAIEFDVMSYVGTIQLALYDGTNTAIQEISSNGHYKIVCDGSTATFMIQNGNTYSQLSLPKTLSGSNFRFGFGFNAQNEGLVFKDFIIYSI